MSDRSSELSPGSTARRVTQSTISAVSNRGLMRFMFYEGALNADQFIAFLRRLAKDAGQKVFLIVENLKVHHATKVKTWVAGHTHEIELFYLPAYNGGNGSRGAVGIMDPTA